MKTLAFLDCPTGISGDMCLGALVSAGVPLSYLQTQLAQLKLPEVVELKESTVRKNGIAATKVDVMLPHETEAEAHRPPARRLHDVEEIITTADLPDRAIAWSLAIFRRLAIAEGAIHGIDPQQVHFHEVGATDAIIDIVGTCLGLDWLGIDELHCAPLPTGRGTVRAAHGRLPVPAPAVLKLMEMAAVPIYNAGLQGELVTPTGAAIATELASHFGDPPAMQLKKVGLGAGHKDFAMPNILRLWIGQTNNEPPRQSAHHHPPESSHQEYHHRAKGGVDSASETEAIGTIQPVANHLFDQPRAENDQNGSAGHDLAGTGNIEARSGLETVVVLETQVDDLSPQAIGYLYDHLLASGALDVFTQSVLMKKSRPGHLITVITYPDQAGICEQILWHETTTLGVRRTQQTRHRLRREIVAVETPLGPVRMKLAFEPGRSTPFKAHPEYEDCASIAQQHQIPWREVHHQSLVSWQKQAATDLSSSSASHQES